MTRREKLLEFVDQNGRGLEIGPNYNPVAPKRDGFHVAILDYLNKDELTHKAAANGITTTASIEAVDFIWKGEPYADLIGERKVYDWIIASHVIEHTPDLIGFLSDCDEVLKDDGILSLAIPDRRYCFDCFRPLTGVGSVIDHHLHGEKSHTPGAVAEGELYAATRNGWILWDALTTSAHDWLYTEERARDDMRRAQEGAFIDTHAWCFTPTSFRLLLHDLHLLGFTPLRELRVHPTTGFEFFATLSRNGRGPAEDRMTLFRALDREIRKPSGRFSRTRALLRSLRATIRRGWPTLLA